MRKESKIRFRSIAGGDRFTCSRLALSGGPHGDRAPWLRLHLVPENFERVTEKTIRNAGNEENVVLGLD